MNGRASFAAIAYRTAWRWHFYAGLFCIPFIVWLALTGSIYIVKPQVDALIDRPYENLTLTGPRATAPALVRAALAAVPGSTLNAYELPQTPRSAVRVLVGRGDEIVRVYVHPTSLQILKVIPEEARFERRIFHLHGELLLGDRGSMLVELAASWAIVMIVTGIYLWWPRGARGLGGVLYPRVRTASGRTLLRDLHGVAGVWVSAAALFFLVSGLPWAASWGGLLKDVRGFGGVTAQENWTTGTSSELAEIAASNAPPHPSASGMPGMPEMDAPGRGIVAYRSLDRMVANVARLNLPPPVLIAPPSAASPQWTARTDTQDRPLRVTYTLDPATGSLLTKSGIDQQATIDRLVAYGVAAHEGQLFAPLNQVLGLLSAAALVVVAVTATLMWWKRRPDRTLGAPPTLGTPRYAPVVIAAIAVLGIGLPLFGLSLVAVVLIERFLLRRIVPARVFLGLPGYTPRGVRTEVS